MDQLSPFQGLGADRAWFKPLSMVWIRQQAPSQPDLTIDPAQHDTGGRGRQQQP
jgi:hypothetical protein